MKIFTRQVFICLGIVGITSIALGLALAEYQSYSDVRDTKPDPIETSTPPIPSPRASLLAEDKNINTEDLPDLSKLEALFNERLGEFSWFQKLYITPSAMHLHVFTGEKNFQSDSFGLLACGMLKNNGIGGYSVYYWDANNSKPYPIAEFKCSP